MYHVQLIPKYSEPVVNISLSRRTTTSIILLSEEIKFNELYLAIVRVERAPTFQHHLTLSMLHEKSVKGIFTSSFYYTVIF